MYFRSEGTDKSCGIYSVAPRIRCPGTCGTESHMCRRITHMVVVVVVVVVVVKGGVG